MRIRPWLIRGLVLSMVFAIGIMVAAMPVFDNRSDMMWNVQTGAAGIQHNIPVAR